MKKLMTVKVVKRRWQRGGEESGLRMEYNNKQCCIGFVARRLGATLKEITGASTLDDIDGNSPCANFRNNKINVLAEAYETNDDTAIKDPERIAKLKELGKKMGIRFTFV